MVLGGPISGQNWPILALLAEIRVHAAGFEKAPTFYESNRPLGSRLPKLIRSLFGSGSSRLGSGWRREFTQFDTSPSLFAFEQVRYFMKGGSSSALNIVHGPCARNDQCDEERR